MRKIILDIYQKLNKYPKRLNHVIEVSNIAMSLAIKHQANINDAKLAGLIHDYSKYEDLNFYNKYIDSNLIDLYKNDTYMYHAISASNYFKKNYKINDNIYSAVYYHVTGRANMSLLEKIIFISDSIYLTGKNNSRHLYKLALNNLDLAVIEAIKLNEISLKKKNQTLSLLQIETLNYYKEINNNEKN